MINEPVPKNKVFGFRWRIVKSHDEHKSHRLNSAIFIGITPKEARNYRVSHFHRNTLSMLGSKSKIFPIEREGFNFGMGDVVEVIVDRTERSIEWRIVERGLSRKVVDKVLGSDQEYFPFVQMLQKDDQIEWLGSWTQ